MRPICEVAHGGESGWYCSGLLGRTSLRHLAPSFDDFLDGPHCSGLLGRTSLRRKEQTHGKQREPGLFRPSRPDFIETTTNNNPRIMKQADCSGLLGRTSLRQGCAPAPQQSHRHCSGLLGRTSLRRDLEQVCESMLMDCSGLLGRTSLRHAGVGFADASVEHIVPAF